MVARAPRRFMETSWLESRQAGSRSRRAGQRRNRRRAGGCCQIPKDPDSRAGGGRADMKANAMSNFEIVAREDFSDVTYLLEVRHPLMAKAARPGQFVIVMLNEHGERIPLTIADFDRNKGTITLVIQAVGKTTKQMQQECQVGTAQLGCVRPMRSAARRV